jgi:hypothetical protein
MAPTKRPSTPLLTWLYTLPSFLNHSTGLPVRQSPVVVPFKVTR